MKKIYFKTAYDNNNTICGYVLADETNGHYIINERQYKNALSKRTIGGDAGIIFINAQKPIVVVNKNGDVIKLC